VDQLVQEFFAQQELKILPQAPFGNAVNQFVSKDDKHAVEMFLMDSLSTQVKGLLQLDDDAVTEGLDAHIADFRKVMEKSYVEGESQAARRRRRFKPKPNGWDSDMNGHWTEQPGVLEEVPSSPEPQTSRRAPADSRDVFSDDEEDLFGDTPAPRARPAAKATTSRATKKAPAKPAAKKAAPARKAPSRGRKKAANPFIDDGEEEDEDVVMEDDDFDLPVAKPAPPPKPTRATRGAAKPKQTTLNFSQSQSQRPAAKKAQKAIEISDDEISDDAFESMPTTRSKRR